MIRVFGIVVTVLMLVAGAGQGMAQDGHAEVPRGLWQTAPDQTGVILHVRTRRCGRALCGRVERAKNRRGYDAPSSAVGERLLWQLKPQPDGSFLGEFRQGNGDVYDMTRIMVQGKIMRLEACNAQSCTSLTWMRIR